MRRKDTFIIFDSNGFGTTITIETKGDGTDYKSRDIHQGHDTITDKIYNCLLTKYHFKDIIISKGYKVKRK